MKKFVIFIIMFFMVTSNAYAKSFSSSRSSFSSSKTSHSSYRSTSSNNSKKTNYSSSSTVDASKWSWNKPSPAPTKPAYQPPKVIPPTKMAITPPKPAYAPKPVVASPKPTYTYVPPVVPRRETKEVHHYHSNGGSDLATVAITAAAITAMSNNAHAQPQQVVINTSGQTPDQDKTVVVSNQGVVVTPKEKPLKFDMVNDCYKWVCD